MVATDSAWERLAAHHPWPEQPPNVAKDPHGWLDEGVQRLLAAGLKDARRAVELGTWLGLSARFMLDRSPDLRLVCVDWWRGDAGIRAREKFARRIPTSYETFHRNCWAYRQRLVAVRTRTLDGMREIHAAGFEPDLVYVDASHDYDPVRADVTLALECFPTARLVGDDYMPGFPGVITAVDEIARAHGFEVINDGRGWGFRVPR